MKSLLLFQRTNTPLQSLWNSSPCFAFNSLLPTFQFRQSSLVMLLWKWNFPTNFQISLSKIGWTLRSFSYATFRIPVQTMQSGEWIFNKKDNLICKQCGSVDLEKILSAPTVGVQKGSPSPACASCQARSPGNIPPCGRYWMKKLLYFLLIQITLATWGLFFLLWHAFSYRLKSASLSIQEISHVKASLFIEIICAILILLFHVLMIKSNHTLREKVMVHVLSLGTVLLLLGWGYYFAIKPLQSYKTNLYSQISHYEKWYHPLKNRPEFGSSLDIF